MNLQGNYFLDKDFVLSVNALTLKFAPLLLQGPIHMWLVFKH
jgi:hypothetical protein